MSGGEMMALVLSLPSVLLVGSFFWRFLSGREFADQEKRRIEAVVRLQELYWLIDAANECAAAEKAQREGVAGPEREYAKVTSHPQGEGAQHG